MAIQDPEIRKSFEILENQIREMSVDADELRTIRATLLVNCKPNSAFGHYGFQYDDSKSTHDNMLRLLSFLSGKIQDLEGA